MNPIYYESFQVSVLSDNRIDGNHFARSVQVRCSERRPRDMVRIAFVLSSVVSFQRKVESQE